MKDEREYIRECLSVATNNIGWSEREDWRQLVCHLSEPDLVVTVTVRRTAKGEEHAEDMLFDHIPLAIPAPRDV